MLTQKKSVGGTHLRGGTRGWLSAQRKHSLLWNPVSFLALANSQPLSGCQEGRSGDALCHLPCPFNLLFSPTLSRIPACATVSLYSPSIFKNSLPHSRLRPPLPGLDQAPPSRWHSGFPLSSVTCGPIILAPKEGMRRRKSRWAEMIKWKGGGDKVGKDEEKALGRRQWWPQCIPQFTRKS